MLSLDCDRLQLGIVPGPPHASAVELSSNSDLHEIVELDPTVVAGALLEITGIACASTQPPTSWKWEATLTASGMTMRLVMTLLEPDHTGPFWGGFSLHGHVALAEICRIAQELRDKLGSVWIHDGNCMMRTPEAFRDAIGATLP